MELFDQVDLLPRRYSGVDRLERLITVLIDKTILIIGLITVVLCVNPTVQAASQGEIGRIDALLTPGYYINFVNKSPIRLLPDESAVDPYHTFKGCANSLVESNFDGRLVASAQATSPAGGKWAVEIYPYLIPVGETEVRICVEGTKVQIKNLKGGETGVKVAEIRIEIFAQ